MKKDIYKARKLFIERNVTNREYVRDVIYFSWMRCKLHNVNCDVLDYGKFISGLNMRKSHDKKYNLFIEKIETLRLDQSEICITDVKGNIIYYKSFGMKSVFRLLSNFNEDVIGTNAIGLSIINKKNEKTLGAEHYNKNLLNYISESLIHFDPYSNTELVVGLITEENKEMTHEENFKKLQMLTDSNGENVKIVNRFTEASGVIVKKEKVSISKGCKLLTLKEIEKNAIEETLKALDWNMQETARVLDIGRSTLYRKVKEFKLNVPK